MKTSYDPEVDALYIRLIKGKYECRTLRLNEEIAFNIGPDEKLIGIVILAAKEVLDSGQLPNIIVENLPPLQKCKLSITEYYYYLKRYGNFRES